MARVQPPTLSSVLPEVEPYALLSIPREATAAEITKAYRKAALRCHPDKVAHADKEKAHVQFQELVFAYSVLSDPVRRARYDKTGSTTDTAGIDDEGFDWNDYFRAQWKDVCTEEAIENFSALYKDSEEEKNDVIAAYKKGLGKWSVIYETVMLSNPLEDEPRFRRYIKEAIRKGASPYLNYTNEPQRAKDKRMAKARKEAKEAGEALEEIKQKGKGKGKAETGSIGDLAALIKSKNADRGASFLDKLEAKYVAEEENQKKKSKGKGKKRAVEEDMPDETAFQAAAERLAKKAKR